MQSYRRQTIQLLLVGMVAAALLMLSSAASVADDGQDTNPRADVWRSVRQGTAGYTAVPSEAHRVLIQTEGQLWREIRNGPLAGISPWILAGVLVVIGLFFVIFGRDRLEEQRSGEMIQRFSPAERVLHWCTATLFVLLALSGLSMLFGRAVLIPVFGQSGFSGYMRIGMFVHNLSGPFFLAGLVIEIVVWIKGTTYPKKWTCAGSGIWGDDRPGATPPCGKSQRRRKSLVLADVSGRFGGGHHRCDPGFPHLGSNPACHASGPRDPCLGGDIVHRCFFRSYCIGTLGAEGTFEGMWRGKVDAVWAKQHQDLWYEKKMQHRPG